MKPDRLLQLAQELEWLGCDAGFYAQKHDARSAENLLERQQELLATADKIERELKGAVRFNLTSLVGVEFPLETALDSVTDLLAGVEDIRQSAIDAVEEVPPKVRQFTRRVENYVNAPVPLAA
ncbi:MAG TPA: hypothetical protein VKU44_06620 [Terriglobia bacterium]|nr:hypothetical protein [Terriglobia bacterium]